MKFLSFTLPGGYTVNQPAGIPDYAAKSGGGLPAVALILRTGIQLFLLVIVLWAFYKIIAGGRIYIMSIGEKDRINTARSQIYHAIWGLVFAFLSFFFVSIFGHLVDINILSLSDR